MEHLFAGWRAQFVTGGERPPGCVFCTIGDEIDHDDQHYVVARGSMSFVVLNLYPYTSGHLMVVPRAHVKKKNRREKKNKKIINLLCQISE
jgi:ATP adenylyltransferase